MIRKREPSVIGSTFKAWSISCWQAANPNCNLAQTLRWGPDQATPYHCDGIFVPAAWSRYLDQCKVLSSPVWEELSDHNPVVASFTPEK